MKYIEAVTVLKQNPTKTFIGIHINKAEREVTMITLHNEENDVGYLFARYSSGRLFNSCGCEDCFELDEIPEDLFRIVNFMNFFEYKNSEFVHDMISEFALCAALPELKCGEGDFLERDDDSVDTFLSKAQEILSAK
jgi:hypothetical protein